MDSAACSSNWLPHSDAGDLQSLLRTSVHSEASTVRLQKPADATAGSCTIDLHLQQPLLAPQAQQLLLSSNARMVEVSVRRPGDATPSYLQTVRCQPQGDRFGGSIDLQGAVGCTGLQLKLLSLQGDKSTCTIHQLHFQQQQQQQQPGPPDHPAAGAADATQQQADAGSADAAGASGPQNPAAPVPSQQAVSQLDELRLLIQQLQQPGDAAPVPESLQLLHSKATAAPQPGAGTAIKNLSAHIAQGMLFQAAQQRAQQQQQHQHHQQQQSPQHDHTGMQDGGLAPAPAHAPAAAAIGSAGRTPASSSAAGSEAGLAGVLSILHRLEAKVDRVVAGLQQLDLRLARLEGSTGRQS